MATPPTHPGSYLDKYTSQQTQFPGGKWLQALHDDIPWFNTHDAPILIANWIQKTAAPPSPPHAGEASRNRVISCPAHSLFLVDADEIVDTDSSDDED